MRWRWRPWRAKAGLLTVRVNVPPRFLRSRFPSVLLSTTRTSLRSRNQQFTGGRRPPAKPTPSGASLSHESPEHSRVRPPLEAVSLSSSEMVNTCAAPLLRARPVRPPVLPPSAHAACSAFSPDVDADVCLWGDGLHSWIRLLPASLSRRCSRHLFTSAHRALKENAIKKRRHAVDSNEP